MKTAKIILGFRDHLIKHAYMMPKYTVFAIWVITITFLLNGWSAILLIPIAIVFTATLLYDKDNNTDEKGEDTAV